MRTDSPGVISEDERTLRRRERRLRGRSIAVRVQALRLLQSGAARTLADWAPLVGQSPRQVARGWATYRREGLEALLREPLVPGRPPRLTPEALGALERVMVAGQIAPRNDAQTSRADPHGIVSPSRNGVWTHLRKHRMTLQPGRRRQALTDAAPQDAFPAGFRRDA